MPEITILKVKYDGSAKRDLTGLLLQERDGWVVIYHEPGIHRHLKYGELVDGDAGSNLFYLNTRLPLTAMSHLLGGAAAWQFVDAALPATFDGQVARFVDLDLDIVAEVGQPAYVRDILDFEEQRRRLGYPPEVVAAAWEGIRTGTELLASGAFPFDGSAPALLEQALAASHR